MSSSVDEVHGNLDAMVMNLNQTSVYTLINFNINKTDISSFLFALFKRSSLDLISDCVVDIIFIEICLYMLYIGMYKI